MRGSPWVLTARITPSLLTTVCSLLIAALPKQERSSVLGDTLIGRDLTSDAVVRLSLKSRMSGLYVIGKQGRGKTNFLLSLIAQDLYHGLGLCVLDPHGDLTVDVLACIPPHREEDVLLLDLQDTQYPFAFDL